MTFEYFVETLTDRAPNLGQTFETVARQNPNVVLALGLYFEAEVEYLDAEAPEHWRVAARRAFFHALADARAARLFEPVSRVVESVARQTVKKRQCERVASFADFEAVFA